MEYRARERQRKRESRRQASEAQREIGRQRSRARDKKTKETFFCWNFLPTKAAVTMRNASGHQCKVKMSGSEKKVNEKTYDISSIKRVNKKFQQVSRCSCEKQLQGNVQKKCGARAKLLFC